MNNFKEHIIGGFKRGISDLKSLYAFHGNSTGDETRTNNIQDYLNSGGWLSFTFDCDLTPEAINKEIEIRKAWNENYIKELKDQGKYGEEYSITIRMEYNPIFDADVKELFESKPTSCDFGQIDTWTLKRKEE